MIGFGDKINIYKEEDRKADSTPEVASLSFDKWLNVEDLDGKL